VYIDLFVKGVSSILEILAAVVVGYGGIITFYRIIIKSFLGQRFRGDYAQARIDLGRTLAVALEFELGADLLQTAISPTWNHIGIVAAIIILRSMLNFLLERDIEHLERQIVAEPQK
jgi:uncharacterized membrane protein